jgi:hypothetical protein
MVALASALGSMPTLLSALTLFTLPWHGRGADLVFHTASPFQQNVQDPQKDLVDPAVKVC